MSGYDPKNPYHGIMIGGDPKWLPGGGVAQWQAEIEYKARNLSANHDLPVGNQVASPANDKWTPAGTAIVVGVYLGLAAVGGAIWGYASGWFDKQNQSTDNVANQPIATSSTNGITIPQSPLPDSAATPPAVSVQAPPTQATDTPPTTTSDTTNSTEVNSANPAPAVQDQDSDGHSANSQVQAQRPEEDIGNILVPERIKWWVSPFKIQIATPSADAKFYPYKEPEHSPEKGSVVEVSRKAADVRANYIEVRRCFSSNDFCEIGTKLDSGEVVFGLMAPSQFKFVRWGTIGDITYSPIRPAPTNAMPETSPPSP